MGLSRRLERSDMKSEEPHLLAEAGLVEKVEDLLQQDRCVLHLVCRTEEVSLPRWKD